MEVCKSSVAAPALSPRRAPAGRQRRRRHRTATANHKERMGKIDPKKYAANLALYEKLVAKNPNVQRKGATMPYTSMNGHMFSLFMKDAYLALRLPPDAQQEFLKK